MGNSLLKKETVRKRLKSLKESYANLAIEDINMKSSTKKFLEDMVRQGFSQEQITEKINQEY
ncbi:MAG: hypothetical protein K8R67_16510 [Desulfobacteraceae bacterium]|nr:hypothetical protein [Desulfobacteraceae bacterium]